MFSNFLVTNKIFSTLLVLILFMVSIVPMKSVKAEEAFIFEGLLVDYQGGDQQVRVQEGDTINPNVETIRLRFNKPPMCDRVSSYAVLFEQNGDLVNWSDNVGQSSNDCIFQVANPLKKNQTYSLYIDSGLPADNNGGYLQNNIKMSLKTNGKSILYSQTMPNFIERMEYPQENVYRFSAEAGPIYLSVRKDANRNKIRLSIQDPETKAILFTSDLGSSAKERTPGPTRFETYRTEFQLPRTGDYNLLVSPVYNGSVENSETSGHAYRVIDVSLTALDLRIADKSSPWVGVSGFYNPFQPVPQQIEANATYYNNPVDLRIYVDGKEAQGLDNNGKQYKMDFTVDTSKLEDGFHDLKVVGAAFESLNSSVYSRIFYVDRENKFRDVPSNHWARTPIEVLNYLGIVHGRSSDRFAPDQPITREEFATLMALILKVKASAGQQVTFADLPDNAWSKPYVDALAEVGLITGENMGQKRYFQPKRTITRAEAAAIIGRSEQFQNFYTGYEEIPVEMIYPDATFPDLEEIPSWARSHVLALAKFKWISGYEDGRFHADKLLTRAQASLMLSKFLGLGTDIPGGFSQFDKLYSFYDNDGNKN